MRSALCLLSGVLLVGAGVGVLLSPLPGRLWWGIGLLVVGLLVKIGGFMLTDDPGRLRPGARRVTTLDGQMVEAPRAGVPAGRSAAFRGTVPHRPARAGAPPVPPAAAHHRDAPPTRRAS